MWRRAGAAAKEISASADEASRSISEVVAVAEESSAAVEEMSVSAEEESSKCRMVVIGMGEVGAGPIVDSVYEVLRLPASMVRPTSSLVTSSGNAG